MSATIHSQAPSTTWRFAISFETLAYAFVFLAALGLRAINLGDSPLNADEARQAMAAWSLVMSDMPDAGLIESPLVYAGAVLCFGLTWATNASARFLPMLGGLALVLTPLLFQQRLGRLPTLLAVGLLTVSPTAVRLSRQVDGIDLSMLGLILALAAFDRYLVNRRPLVFLLAGTLTGIAYLADFGFPVALLAMAAGLGFALLTDEEDTFTIATLKQTWQSLPWTYFIIGLLAALTLLGTLFLLAPNGFSAAADQITRFLTGLTRRVPGSAYLGLILPFYEPTLTAFGLAGAWLASQSTQPWHRFLAGWAVAAILLGLIYPGAQPGHALWGLVPLALLSGLAIDALLNLDHAGPAWVPWLQAVGLIALIAMIAIALIGHLRTPTIFSWPPHLPPEQATIKLPIDLLLAFLWIVLIVLLWLTISGLWGTRAAAKGTGLGLLLIGITLALGQSAALASTRATNPYELLNVSPAQPALDALVETAQEVSRFATGHPHLADITVQAPPDSELAWALRDFNHLTFTIQVNPTVDSVMVITPATEVVPALGSNYVGQDFVITRSWTPGSLSLEDYLRWIFYRIAPSPHEEVRVILWVREDVYRLVQAGGF